MPVGYDRLHNMFRSLVASPKVEGESVGRAEAVVSVALVDVEVCRRFCLKQYVYYTIIHVLLEKQVSA
jgi:hypothetical protein